MLIPNEDGTFTGGPLDVICLLYDTTRGTYHAAFFEEAPFPGPIPDMQDTKLIRLKSRMHRTEGTSDLYVAHIQLEELAKKIRVPSENLWREPRAWDGEAGVVWLLPNWRTS